MSHRKTYSRTSAIFAAAAAAALLLTGCGQSSGSVTAEDSPLQKYLGSLYQHQEFSKEDQLAQERKLQEAIAACMQKEGFEYTPYVSESSLGYTLDSDELEGPDPDTLEFAKIYGYGLQNSPWQEQIDQFDDSSKPEDDPNYEYMMSLSASEQEQYSEALYGPQPTEEQIAEAEESGDWGFEQGGCYYEAQKESNEQFGAVIQAYEDPEFTELFMQIEQLYAGIYNTPGRSQQTKNTEIKELDQKWSECMADAGYDYGDPYTAANDLQEQLNALYEANTGAEYTEPDKAALDKALQEEIAVATADYTCRGKLSYDDKLQQAIFKIEQEFIDEHKQQLEALVAKYGNKQ